MPVGETVAGIFPDSERDIGSGKIVGPALTSLGGGRKIIGKVCFRIDHP